MTTTDRIDAVLERTFAQTEIPEDIRGLLNRLRQRLSGAASEEDLRADVQRLYSAEGCDTLATSLLWLIERSGQFPESDITSEEEAAVSEGVARYLSSRGVFPEQIPNEDQSSAVISASAPEPDEMPGEPEVAPVLSTGEGPDLAAMGQTLEQFLEAIQAGGDDRASILEDLHQHCQRCMTGDGVDPVLQKYGAAVDDFLGYIRENELLDDVRVMNFVTNIQEPFAQWLAAPEEGRAGILEQGVEFLSDFRAMFE